MRGILANTFSALPVPCMNVHRTGPQSKGFLSYYFGGGDSEDSEEGKRNNILQKAIMLYIGHVSLSLLLVGTWFRLDRIHSYAALCN